MIYPKLLLLGYYTLHFAFSACVRCILVLRFEKRPLSSILCTPYSVLYCRAPDIGEISALKDRPKLSPDGWSRGVIDSLFHDCTCTR